MTVLYNVARFGSLWRVQIWACERLIALDLASGDFRLAIVALTSRTLNAAWNSLYENIAGRAWQGARFAERMTAADTRGAAAGR